MRIEHPGFARLLVLVVLLNLLAAQLLHEAGHWAVAQAFGHRPVWGFTSVVQTAEQPPSLDGWSQITNPDGSPNWLRMTSIPNSDAERVLFLVVGPRIHRRAARPIAGSQNDRLSDSTGECVWRFLLPDSQSTARGRR